jgi:heterotetrameric sarcosine oxidase delta subunit
MAFLIDCPNCGSRNVYEFRFGGESRVRPTQQASDDEWQQYIYMRANKCGVQDEWWYHRDGCGRWFVARRDTSNNRVLSTCDAKEKRS